MIRLISLLMAILFATTLTAAAKDKKSLTELEKTCFSKEGDPQIIMEACQEVRFQSWNKNAKEKALKAATQACSFRSEMDCAFAGSVWLEKKEFHKARAFFMEAYKINEERRDSPLGINPYFAKTFYSELAKMLLTGAGGPIDSQLAKTVFEQGCEVDDGKSCAGLGIIITSEPNPDFPRAALVFNKACDAGFGLGCFMLADMKFKGEGIEQDLTGARELYSKACEQNEFMSCKSLAVMWYLGKGGPQLPPKALELFTKACNGKNKEACRYCGTMWTKGEGTTRSDKKASEYFSKGCDLEDSNSCYWMGLLHGSGALGKINTKKAYEYLKKACILGSSEACESMR